MTCGIACAISTLSLCWLLLYAALIHEGNSRRLATKSGARSGRGAPGSSTDPNHACQRGQLARGEQRERKGSDRMVGAGDDAEGAVDVAKARKQVLVVSKRVVNVRRTVNHERRRAHLTRRSAIRLRPVGGVKQEFLMGKPRRGRER